MKNYEHHKNTISHQLAIYYWQNIKIQISENKLANCLLKCHINSLKVYTIDEFFCSIKSDFIRLINQVKNTQKHGLVNVKIKLFALYNQTNLKHESNYIDKIKIFVLKNEVINNTNDLL